MVVHVESNIVRGRNWKSLLNLMWILYSSPCLKRWIIVDYIRVGSCIDVNSFWSNLNFWLVNKKLFWIVFHSTLWEIHITSLVSSYNVTGGVVVIWMNVAKYFWSLLKFLVGAIDLIAVNIVSSCRKGDNVF